jgi:PAS domain S-box-containing protein
MKSIIANEYRCDCGKLLFKGLLLDSKIEIKCKHCQKIMTLGGVFEGMTGNNDYSVAYDKQGKLVAASKSMEEILGYSALELKTLFISDIDPTVSSAIFNHTWQLALEMENHLTGETCHIKKDGTKIQLKAKVSLVSEGDKELILFLCKVQPKIKEGACNADFAETLLHARDFTVNIDLHGQIIHSSPDMENFLGHAPIDIYTKSVFDYIPKGHSDFSLEFLNKMIKTGKAFRLQGNAFLKKNGEILPVESYFNPIFDENNHVLGYVSCNWIK